MSKLEEYRPLKLKYFQILKKRSLGKGKLRSLVGLFTWYLETETYSGAGDLLTAHISAFSDALAQASLLNSEAEVSEKLESLKAEWLHHKKREFSCRPSTPLIEPPIKEIWSWKHNGFNVVSLFSGAMGLDIGFMAAGFDIRVANDIDPKSKETIELNVPQISFIFKDINTVSTDELLATASLKKGEVDVLIGGPPCQPFSPAGKRLGLSDPRASPLKYFVRAIKELKPKVFVMEEVPGILSSRLRHLPISERSKRELTEEEKPGSAFKVILEMLASTGYKFTYGRLNAADFGSPQLRERIIFIGLRDGKPTLPEITHSDSSIPGTLPWNTFWEATLDITGCVSDSAQLSPKTLEYMKHVPPGGNWRELPPEHLRSAMGGAYIAGGGKVGFYRRLSWDEPSPTLVTSPIQKGTLLVHPELNRPLTVKEYARLQGFPDDWKIAGSVMDKYRLIGNAVPVHLSYAIALHVRGLLEGKVLIPKRGIFSYV